MADDAHEKAASSWTEFRDGKPAGEAKQRDIVNARLIVAALALVAAVIFIVQNDNRVETNFLFFDGSPRLWVVILVSVLLGALLGQVAGVMARRRKKQG